MASSILRLPDYCDIYKNFIVEELVFVESPLHYHYGKCAVIGQLLIEDTNYYLGNIKLRCLDKEYRLETGSIRILLLPSTPLDAINGVFVEVYGETEFRSIDQTQQQKSLSITTKDVFLRLRKEHLEFNEETEGFRYSDKNIETDACQMDEINIAKKLKEFSSQHVHAIQVHTINVIDQAEAVIECNLKLRMVMKKRDEINGK